MAIQFMNLGSNPGNIKLFCFYFFFKIGQTTPSFSFLITLIFVVYGLFDVRLRGLKIRLKKKVLIFEKKKNKSVFKSTKSLKIAKMWFSKKKKKKTL
jgi:hypothetical protein